MSLEMLSQSEFNQSATASTTTVATTPTTSTSTIASATTATTTATTTTATTPPPLALDPSPIPRAVYKYSDLDYLVSPSSTTTLADELTYADIGARCEKEFGFDRGAYNATVKDYSKTGVSNRDNFETGAKSEKTVDNRPDLDRYAIFLALKHDLSTHHIDENIHNEKNIYNDNNITQHSICDIPSPTPPLSSYQSRPFGLASPHFPHHSSSRSCIMPSYHSSPNSSQSFYLPGNSAANLFGNRNALHDTDESHRIVSKWLFFFGFLIMPCWWVGAIYVVKEPTPDDYKWKKLCINASIWGLVALAAIGVIWVCLHPTAFGSK